MDEMVSALISNVDETLKETKKKWSQTVSLRLFYREDVKISSVSLQNALVSEILHRTSTIPALNAVPVSALGSKSESLIACVLHIV